MRRLMFYLYMQSLTLICKKGNRDYLCWQQPGFLRVALASYRKYYNLIDKP